MLNMTVDLPRIIHDTNHLAIVDAQDQLVGMLFYESLIRLRDSIIHQATAALLVSQQKIHERIAKAEPLKDVLIDLLQMMEAYLRGSSCAITLCQDGQLGEVTTLSLPQDYAVAVEQANLPIAEGVGSCGTAMFRRELVVVTDIANDPLWQDYKNFALAYDLQACCSMPIFASDRTLLGAFGIYYHEQKAPLAQELDWIAQAANIAGIAIDRDRATQALQQLNHELENRVQVRTQELQEREQFLQTVLDTFPISVFWKDVNSVYLGCNQNFLHDAGLQEISQIIGKTDDELPWGETEADFFRANDRAVIESQTAKLRIEETQHHADGQIIWTETNKIPLRNLQGEVIGVLGTYQDISDRQKLEQAQIRLTAILESTPDYIGIANTQGEILWHNRQLKELRPELDNGEEHRFVSECHPDWVNQIIFEQALPTAIEKGSWSGELALLDGTGKEIPVSQVIIAHKLANGIVESFSTIMRDISDRKAAEKALMLKQKHLAALMNNIPHLAWINDEQSRIIAVNEPFAQTFGVSTEEVVGKTAYDICPADLAQAYHDDDAEVLQSGQRKVVVERCIRADGTLGWFETTKTPFRDDQLNIAGTVGISADITDRKRMEIELAESEAKFRYLVEGGQDLIWAIDTQYHFTYLSPQFTTLFGWDVSEWIGRPSNEAVYPEDRGWLIEQQTLETVYFGMHNLEFRHCHRDHPYVWVRVSATAITDSTGAVVGYQGVLSDISTLKQAELALKASERRYASLAAAAPVAIFRFDTPLNCVYVNERWSQMSGRPVESALGHGWMESLHPDDSEQRIAEWAEYYAHSNSKSQIIIHGSEGRQLRPDGSTVWSYIQVAKEFDDDDNVVGYVGTLTDITDRKNTELALQESLAKFRRMTESVPGDDLSLCFTS